MNKIQIAYNIAFIVSGLVLILFAFLLFGQTGRKKKA